MDFKSSSTVEERPARTMKQLTQSFSLALCGILMANAAVTTSVLSFVAFMVLDFGVASSDTQVGYYSGFLGGAFLLSMMLSSPLWGHFSDKHGRKQTLLVTIPLESFLLVCFGFSPTYAWALAFRAVGGLFSCQFTIAKAMLSDWTDDENKQQAFSLLSLAWGVGSLVGPAMGGLLASPAETWPSCFAGTLFESYPYVLSCMVLGAFNLVAGGFGFVFYPEAFDYLDGQRSAAASSSSSEQVEQGQQEASSLLSNDGEQDTLSSEFQDRMLTGPCSVQVSLSSSIWLLIASFAVYGLIRIGFSEIFPIWALTEEASAGHGLGFTAVNIGVSFALGGACMFVFQLWFYTPMAQLLGEQHCLQLGAICLFFTPITTMAAGYVSSQTSVWFLVAVSMMLDSLAVCIFSTSYDLLMNNALVSSGSKQFGYTHGVGVAISAGMRAMGPILGSSLFSWTVSDSSGVDWRFSFLILSFSCLLLILLGAFISTDLDSDKLAQYHRSQLSEDEEAILKKMVYAEFDATIYATDDDASPLKSIASTLKDESTFSSSSSTDGGDFPMREQTPSTHWQKNGFININMDYERPLPEVDFTTLQPEDHSDLSFLSAATTQGFAFGA